MKRQFEPRSSYGHSRSFTVLLAEKLSRTGCRPFLKDRLTCFDPTTNSRRFFDSIERQDFATSASDTSGRI
jgi:hypothetical protein